MLTLAFPSISTGIYGYPIELASDPIAIDYSVGRDNRRFFTG